MFMKNLLTLPSLLVAIGLGTVAAPALAGPHWAYAGHHAGPAAWAHLAPEFETCALGHAQSPINITRTHKAELPALAFDYPPAAPTLFNNGHTVQVNLPPGRHLQVGEQRYELLQFHFHTPSEEQIHGRRAAMVAHFVHRDDAGHLGVVAVLMQVGRHPHAGYGPLFQHLPRPAEQVTVEGLTLDVAALLPRRLAYYDFEGSLTTPPCSEGVHWMVLKDPVQLDAGQVAAFRRLFPANARPVQPLNGREVKESS